MFLKEVPDGQDNTLNFREISLAHSRTVSQFGISSLETRRSGICFFLRRSILLQEPVLSLVVAVEVCLRNFVVEEQREPAIRLP
jgi:hypothetical protein